MDATMQFSEANEVLGLIPPTTAKGVVGAHQTGWMDIADFHRAFVLLVSGTPGAAGSTIDVAVWEAQDSNGTGAQLLTGAHAVAGKVPDTILAGDTGEYVGIEIQSEEFDVTNSYHYFNVIVTVGVDTYTYNLVVFGTIPRYLPADQSGYLELVDK